MTSIKLTTVVFALLIVGTAFQSVSEAQRRSPVQGVGRWLGHGYGDGYHKCNPLSDPGYYNPYSVHNSMLIHRSPMYANSAIQSTDLLRYGRFHQGIPFSVYAAPAGSSISSFGNNFQAIPGQTIKDNSFEPYEEEDEDEASDEDEDNKDTASIFNPDIISSPLPTTPERKSVNSATVGFKDDNSFQGNGELNLESSDSLELKPTESNLINPFK